MIEAIFINLVEAGKFDMAQQLLAIEAANLMPNEEEERVSDLLEDDYTVHPWNSL